MRSSKRFLRPVWMLTGVALLASAPASAQPVSGETVGIKNFRQYVASLETATGIRANQNGDIFEYLAANMERLPKHGLVTEISGPGLITAVGLAGYFCGTRLRIRGSDYTTAEQYKQLVQQAIQEHAWLFLDREPTAGEIKELTELATLIAESNRRDEIYYAPQASLKMRLSICVAYAASLEFIAH